MPKKYGFSRKERIKSEKDIRQLLKNNNKIFHYPILAKWSVQYTTQEKPPIKVAFLVSKHRFGKAVDRNLIKRRMREAYRLSKAELSNIKQNKNFALNILLIYISPQILPFKDIKQAISSINIDIAKEITTISFE